MANLEDRINASNSKSSGLERTIEKSDWSLGKIVKDTLLYSPLAAGAFYLGGLASLLTPIGLGIGKWIVNRKKGKKTTWKEMRRTLAVANWGGALAFWAYAAPDYIIGSPTTLMGKILKTVLFNPIMVFPWITWYRSTNYVVGKYGTPAYLKGFLNGNVFKYTKESYDKDLKHKLLPTSLEAFLTLSPIHFFSMNYVANPTYRVGIGAVNDILFSLIAGEEGLLRTIKRKFSKKKDYVPKYSPSPSYAPT